jgi:hypothetical protein
MGQRPKVMTVGVGPDWPAVWRGEDVGGVPNAKKKGKGKLIGGEGEEGWSVDVKARMPKDTVMRPSTVSW